MANTESPTTNAPSIVALEQPSEMELLKEKLATLEKTNGELAFRETQLGATNRSLAEDLKAAGKKIHALEKNPLMFALSELDAGAVLEDAGGKLKELTAEVMRRSEKGRFTLSITVKPFKGGALVFVPEVKTTPPKPEPMQSIFYASEAGDLSRNDPKQKEFGFSSADRSGNADPDPYADERKDPLLR